MAAYFAFFIVIALFRKIPLIILFSILSILSFATLFLLSEDTLLATYNYGVFRCLGSFFAGCAIKMLLNNNRLFFKNHLASFVQICSLLLMFILVIQTHEGRLYQFAAIVSFFIVIFIFASSDGGMIEKVLRAPYLNLYRYNIIFYLYGAFTDRFCKL